MFKYGKIKPSEIPIIASDAKTKEQRIEEMKNWQEQNCKG